MKNLYIAILLSSFYLPNALATNVSQDAESQLQELISRKASVREILNFCATSRKHQTLCANEGLWVSLIKRDFGDGALEMNKFPTAKDHYKHLYKMRAAAAPIDILEPELKALVLSKTSMRSILNFCASSHAHQKLCAAENEDLWHGLVVRDFGGIYNPKSEIFKTWKEQYVHLTKLARGTMIAASISHAVLLDNEGNVWTFGKGDDGSLGHGDTKDQAIPKMIESLKNRATRIVSAAAGLDHTVLLDAEGKVWTFGFGARGQLGHGNFKVVQTTPKMIENLPKIMAIAAGELHTVLLDTEGNVWTFGRGFIRVLGYRTEFDQDTPKKIDTLPVKIGFVAANFDDTVLVDIQGNVWNFGLTIPKKLENLSAKIVAAAISGDHTELVDSEGNVWAYGPAHIPKLGVGPIPKMIKNLPTKIVSATVGADHAVLLDIEGHVWTFGMGYFGKLGHGNERDQDKPKKIESRSRRVIAVASDGLYTALLIDEDGKAWTFGRGINNKFASFSPMQLEGYSNARSE